MTHRSAPVSLPASGLRGLAASALLALCAAGTAVAQTPSPAAHGITDHPPEPVQRDLRLLDELTEGRPLTVAVDPSPETGTARVYDVELSSSLIFPVDSAELSARLMAQVEDAVYLARQPELAGWTIRIVGHADRTGSEAHNQALSLRRAESARDYMVARGVEASRIEVVAGGELADDPQLRPSISQALNRRVELVVMPR